MHECVCVCAGGGGVGGGLLTFSVKQQVKLRGWGGGGGAGWVQGGEKGEEGITHISTSRSFEPHTIPVGKNQARRDNLTPAYFLLFIALVEDAATAFQQC